MSLFTPHDILDPDKRHTMTVPLEFRIAKLERENADMLAALNAATGYLLNAKIDLETGAPKKTAIDTIEGGLRVVRAAIAKAEGRTP